MYDLVFLHAPSVYDFRERATLWGPISDLVPSTPVFDMYPIGFATLMAHLQQAGFRVRIANLAARMVRAARFRPEKLIAAVETRAFGIDLHWLPHAHGALEVAKLAKTLHPDVPVIFGGYSATYFHEELVRYPFVDYVLRGDSTEHPLEQLMEHILDRTDPVEVPNLTWKDRSGGVHVNPLTYMPENLDHLVLDYHPLVKSVVRDRNLLDYVPFSHWLAYPIMAALMVKGFTRSELASNLTKGEQFLTFTVAANLEKAGEHTIWVASYTIFMGETGSDKIVVVGTVTTSPPTNQTSPGLPVRAYKVEAYKIVLSGVVKGYVDGEVEEVDGVLYCWRAEPSLPYEGNSSSNQSTAFLRGGIFGGVMKVGGEAYWIDEGSVFGRDGLNVVKLEGDAKALFLMSRAEGMYSVEGVLKADGFLGSFKGTAKLIPFGYHLLLDEAGS